MKFVYLFFFLFSSILTSQINYIDSNGMRQGEWKLYFPYLDSVVSEQGSFINNLEEGWVALWANKYYFPESSIQVICNDQFDSFNDFISCGYQELSKKGYAEEILPFTHVERGFLGDRFGEKYLNQIYGVDYFCQVKKDVNIISDGMNEFPSSFTIDLWRFLWKFRTVQLFWSYRYFILICFIVLFSLIFLCNFI